MAAKKAKRQNVESSAADTHGAAGVSADVADGLQLEPGPAGEPGSDAAPRRRLSTSNMLAAAAAKAGVGVRAKTHQKQDDMPTQQPLKKAEATAKEADATAATDAPPVAT